MEVSMENNYKVYIHRHIYHIYNLLHLKRMEEKHEPIKKRKENKALQG